MTYQFSLTTNIFQRTRVLTKFCTIYGFNYTIGQLNHTAEWAAKTAMLKRNCFAVVFEKYFELQAKGGEKTTAIIHYRDKETM